ncbi:MAG: hypothetical protein ACREE9_13095 [Stellaceae bacterium]
MMLTPIPRDALAEALERFADDLGGALSRRMFGKIRATSPDRAAGPEAEQHRLSALALARGCGMMVHPPGVRCRFNWDGAALNGATEAYVILHEIAHFVLAPPARRSLVDFGLGPGPDTTDRDQAERAATLSPLARDHDEAAASLLGILWEAALGQPALASFLDQNWLEGLGRSACGHFARVLGGLQRRGLLAPLPRPAAGLSGGSPQPAPAIRRIR